MILKPIAGVDEHVAFLKQISLQIKPDNFDAFFNHKDMDFPLFQLATKFYDSNENLIKTSSRTIIL